MLHLLVWCCAVRSREPLPCCRYLADAAPQKGEASMRSGAQAPDDDSTRQFKAQSQRLMGDMNDAGDAPFGGEVQIDSQVRAHLLFLELVNCTKHKSKCYKMRLRCGVVASIYSMC